jgi:NTP pyrophosphatase (non-canonical NTP hydrolase)
MRYYIDELQKESHKIAVEHGFWESIRNYGEMIALMHSELSELLEAYRHGDLNSPSDHCPHELTCQEEEMADLMIRVMDLAEHENIDLGRCISVKSNFNKTRPRMHGKKC